MPVKPDREGRRRMILVAGGAFQGKLQFSRELFRKISAGNGQQGDFRPVIADGAVCTPEEAQKADILNHFHELIRRFPELFTDPAAFVSEWEENCPDQVLVTNELGYGVVPVDPEDRRWREQCGRVCTALAAQCQQVYRVVCGIGVALKAE